MMLRRTWAVPIACFDIACRVALAIVAQARQAVVGTARPAAICAIPRALGVKARRVAKPIVTPLRLAVSTAMERTVVRLLLYIVTAVAVATVVIACCVIALRLAVPIAKLLPRASVRAGRAIWARDIHDNQLILRGLVCRDREVECASAAACVVGAAIAVCICGHIKQLDPCVVLLIPEEAFTGNATRSVSTHSLVAGSRGQAGTLCVSRVLACSYGR